MPARRDIVFLAAAVLARAVRVDLAPKLAASLLDSGRSGGRFPLHSALAPLLGESRMPSVSWALGTATRLSPETLVAPDEFFDAEVLLPADASLLPAVFRSDVFFSPDMLPESPQATEEVADVLPTWTNAVEATLELELPPEWEGRLVPQTVTMHRTREGYAGRAFVAAAPWVEVSFVAARATSIYSLRDLAMQQRLSGSGGIPTLFEHRMHNGMLYTLTEWPSGKSLNEYLWGHFATLNGKLDPRHPFLPAEDALPILIDVLRCLVELERQGIVHGSLTEGNIVITRPDKRALLTDFGSACLLESDHVALACKCSFDDGRGSAYRHAPEMRGGCCTGVSNNIWQAGLIFTKMLFGPMGPTSTESMDWSPRPSSGDDTTLEGRERIRSTLRKRFAAKGIPGVSALSPEHGDLAELLAGMLESDPDRRWTAASCLSAARAAALRRDLASRPYRAPGTLPDEWQQEHVEAKEEVEAEAEAEEEDYEDQYVEAEHERLVA